MPAAFFFDRYWSNLPVRSKALVSIGVPVAALGLAGLALHSVAALRQKETRLWLEHTHEVRAVISSIRSDLLQTESDARAFVITRREDLLPPLANGEKGLDGRMSKLQDMVRDNPIQAGRVKALRGLLPANFASTEKMVGAARAKAIQAPKTALLLGNQTMQPIEELLLRLDQEEAQLERQRTAANDRARQLLVSAGTAALILALFGGLTATFLFGGFITRGLERLQLSARAIRSKSGLRATVPSGDEMGLVEKEMELTSDLMVDRTRALHDCESGKQAGVKLAIANADTATTIPPAAGRTSVAKARRSA